MTIKFYHYWLKRGVHALFWITSGKQICNNYASCFNRIDFVVIHSYTELPSTNQIESSIINRINQGFTRNQPISTQNWLESWRINGLCDSYNALLLDLNTFHVEQPLEWIFETTTSNLFVCCPLVVIMQKNNKHIWKIENESGMDWCYSCI